MRFCDDCDFEKQEYVEDTYSPATGEHVQTEGVVYKCTTCGFELDEEEMDLAERGVN